MDLKHLSIKIHTNSVSDIEEISYLWKTSSMGLQKWVMTQAMFKPNAVNTDYKGMLSVNYIQVW
jgi:hypothetical protein